MKRESGLLDVLLLLLLSALWGASFLFIKIVLETVPPLTLVAGRVVVAALTLTLILYWQGGRLPKPGRDWLPFLVMGFFNNAVPFTLISWGEVYIDSGLAAILNATMPFFTAMIAHFVISDERLNRNKGLGIGLGLLGVLVLIGPGALRGLGLHVWGQLAIVAASLSYAVATVFSRLVLRRQQQNTQLAPQTLRMKVAASQLMSATFFVLPVSLVVDRPWTLRPAMASLAALLVLAVFGTAVAYIIYFRLLSTAGATFTSMVTYLLPISGIFWGALLLDERLSGLAIAALLLILSGVAIVNGQLPRLLKRRLAALGTAKP